MKNRLLHSFILLLLAAAVGCSDDCPVCPADKPEAEKEYHLIYSYGNPGYWVYTFSTKSLKIVDSVSYSGNPFEGLQFTRDGKYACYSKPGVTWVTEYATGDTIAIDNGHGGRHLSFSRGDRMVLVSADSRTVVFGFPQLDILYSLPSGLSANAGSFDPTENVAYVPCETQDSLLIIRFDSTGVNEHKIGLTVPGGTPKYPQSAIVTLDGSTLLLNLMTADGSKYLELRDTDSLKVQAEYYPSYGGPLIHPDGRRAFFVSSGGASGDREPTAMYVLDLMTLIWRKVLDGDDYQISSPYRVFREISQIDFTPDGRYAFLRSGFGLSGSPPIAKLDLDTYEIVDAIYPHHGVSRAMRIYPLEINGGN